ncbi:hypothetical protein HUT06_12970 [Actinomadura sp. NAK00032]|uniref:hypothetical protein n=1 Tax=Actinomadura sp. NAK00032 TaxID=2742128 RepID=UPI0015927D75|nr:hypothetical protein [Actinomadura sp. NAK00032]QKW34826.1 hypothetical protein HUT06_12970 [Actinomadura sp. NAK00032]
MTEPGHPQFTAEQVKHLEFIQAVVTRLGNGSFLIKGWTLTLVAAFLGVSLSSPKWRVTAVALVPVLGFWLVDAYFLRQERLFRKLYDQARIPGGPVEVFSMNTAPYAGEVKWPQVVGSTTLRGFYGTLVLIIVAVVVAVALG